MKSKILALLLCIAVVVALVLGFKALKKESDNTTDLSSDVTDYVENRPNADDYYSENSVSLIEIPVSSSEDVQSEKEALKDFRDRGFEQYSAFTSYSIEGEYYSEIEIGEKNEKHPEYDMYYLDANDRLWSLSLINGTITAYPIWYNTQEGIKVEVIMSESNSVTSYDSKSSKFYETIPKEDVLIVKKFSRIDAALLDSIIAEDIR